MLSSVKQYIFSNLIWAKTDWKCDQQMTLARKELQICMLADFAGFFVVYRFLKIIYIFLFSQYFSHDVKHVGSDPDQARHFVQWLRA